MASFVREVLSAAGTLDEKEDFAAKAIKIEKKLSDLKCQLGVQIEKRYGNYSLALSSPATISTQMERVYEEIQNLDASINKHFRAELVDRNKELIELNQAMQELTLTFQIVTKIKECYDLMEATNDSLHSGKLYQASKCMKSVLDVIHTPCTHLDETSFKIFPAIKKELVDQKLKLTNKLKNKWSSTVFMEKKEDSKTKTESFKLVFNVNGEQAHEDFKDLAQALNSTGILEDVLQPFVKTLKTDFLENIITGRGMVEVTKDSVLVSISKSGEVCGVNAIDVMQNLMHFFAFLFKHCNVTLSLEEPQVLLQEMIGSKLANWFCNALIKEVLAPAVPSCVSKLPDYQDVVDKTEVVNEYLVENKFLVSTNMTLLNYARNVDALFANKVCQDLLSKARDIMKEDMFTTIEIIPDNPQEGDILNDTEEHTDLPISPNFSVPDKLFLFPRCKISKSTIKILDLAVESLDIAAKSKPFCSVRLFHTVRNVFELWCAVVPTYHRSNLESLPQLAAIGHNSGMYLAHRLVTLGFLYKDKLGAMTQTPTFIDIVCKLRDVAAEMMLNTINIQRDNLLSILTASGMTSTGSDRRMSSGVDQAVRQFLHQLDHLQKVWQPTLPSDVYYRSIGALLNAGLEEIILKIVGLTDISAEMSGQFCSLFNQIINKTPMLFKPDTCPHKFVKRWGKFNELITVLDSSLRVLEDRWGEGAGPLAKEFSADEVKQMIRAIFQNTERRAAVLSKIK